MIPQLHRNHPRATTVRALAFGLLLLLPTGVLAEGYGGRAGAFLRMGAGAAALGSGDAGVGRALGAEQLHYNPAGLAFAPSSAVHVGYHALSLDRHLSHTSALYQIPSLSSWDAPMEPLVALSGEQMETASGLLVRPEETDIPKHRREVIAPDEYAPALAQLVIELRGLDDAEHEAGRLAIGSRTFRPGALRPLLSRLVAKAKEEGWTTQKQVLDHLLEEYRRVQKKPAAIALSWTHASTDDIQGRDTNGNYYGELGFFENRFAFAFSLRLHRTLSAGVTLGVLYAVIPDMLENETEPLSSTTFGGDVGLQFRPFNERPGLLRRESLVIGLAAYDIGAKNTWNTSGYWNRGTTRTDHFPNRYRAGFGWRPIAGLGTYLDLETDLDALLRPKGGVAFSFVLPEGGSLRRGVAGKGETGFTLRAGVDRDRPTFGLGFALPVFGLGDVQLDYAYVVEPVSPEATQVLTWRFRF